MQLKEFRDEYLDLLLSFLWRQWSSLGVGGYAESEDNWIIDPEALLLFSFSIARYDARLFDEVLDWLNLNGKFINIQRFKNILKKYPFSSKTVLSAVAEKMIQLEPRRKNKWLQIAKLYPNNKDEVLFFAKNGIALPVGSDVDIDFKKHRYERNSLILRNYSTLFKPDKPVSLILKLRALLGLNARCEILSYLADEKTVHPSRIAKDTFYYQKTIQDALVDMELSGAIYCSTTGREKRYRLLQKKWSELLGLGNDSPKWINWVPLFFALEKIWMKISFLSDKSFNSLLLASEIKELTKEITPEIEQSGFALENKNLYYGESTLSYFISDIRKILG